MPKNRLYLFIFLFGGMAFVLVALLAFTTVRNVIRDKTLIMQNTLTQGYWIARSVEIGHSMMMQNHIKFTKNIIKELEKNHPAIRFIVIVDENKQVLIASDATLEGTLWPADLGNLPEHGRMIKSDSSDIDLAFPAFFARSLQNMPQHPREYGSLNTAQWIIVGLDVSEDRAHYRNIVIQSIFVSISIVIFGLGAFFFFGMIQRYHLASASLAKLEHIKRHLARFVPGTVQKLIEDNPEKPLLDKVTRHATILFLDIERYTKISAGMSPEALNRLIETYFSAFLDIILSHGGEINETAGDGIMAIFTGKSLRTHARNAVSAALDIGERACALSRERTPHEPEILVNLGINTGQVLLGATMIKGAAGERFTYTASGMVTNIAARLCGLSTNGEIHLSKTTAQLVMDRFKLHGPHEVGLKNVQGTTPVYKLERAE